MRNRCIGSSCDWCDNATATITVEDSIGNMHRDGCLWLKMDRAILESKGATSPEGRKR